MIKQKGTTNAIDRLLRSTTVSTDQTFDTYEEWAFKVGDFVLTNFNQQIELRLRAQDIITDPMFEFVLPTMEQQQLVMILQLMKQLLILMTQHVG